MIETYYDNLMNSKDMTIRLFSEYNPYTKSNSGPIHEILRFPMTEMYNVNVAHSYKGLTPGISGLYYTLKNAFQKAQQTTIPNMYTEYYKVLDAIQSVTNFSMSLEDFDERLSRQQFIRHPISVADYFKAFAGTTVQVPLNFSIRLYSYYNRTRGLFLTADDQLFNISKYFVGPQVGGITGRMTQYGPPNGFQEYRSYSGEMTQTGFSVRFGRMLDISKLLITNFNFSPSKEFESRSGAFGNKSRLYYNVSFNLMPIYAITVLDIIKMFAGSTISPEGNANLSKLTTVSEVKDDL